MTWYPTTTGGEKAEADAAAGEAIADGSAAPSRSGQTVITRADDLPTVALPAQKRKTRPDYDHDEDDDPTVARLGLGDLHPASPRTAPDEPTLDDEDPTIKHKALRRQAPRAELLDHRYQLSRQIGAGGMGEVWQARHVQLGREVAIKFLTNEEGGPRFKLEAQAIASVRHTGVVDVLDFGETSQGVPYFVMDLLEGQTLSKRVRATGPLSWALVRNIALEVADALAHAHAVGVIHRDLKPSNVIVLDNPPQRGSSTKLIDFGIAKLLGDHAPKLTQAGFVQGTPAYMSPEQVLGEDVDARTDVYGLGCLLYYLLSAQRPFPDKSGAAALRAQLDQLPPRFAEVVPGQSIPPEVEALVFRAIAKEKHARFDSMWDMQAAIIAIPPDASASMSGAAPPHKLKPTDASASSSIRTTDSYGALSPADSAPTDTSSNTYPSTSASASSAVQPSSSIGGRVMLVLAVVVSLGLLGAAITGLIWALTG
ncbi:Serine/threonine protein kinase [Enhygromyxa salina]|uniref:Serine/threonine protein kinase n=1 Tax=Enhygromyxa salina TaxID=215803 RepID=A0A0C1ZW76_9BACT|nr:serine/threonine-protein kinase [Enhygromyxa salina]KIG15288.1 Serine/threonine protein kinase [Enhygromyxa salina]